MTIHGSHEEGRRLARALGGLRRERPFVLGIPRGGVTLADAVARALDAPLDVLIAGKVLVPGEIPIAGVAMGGGLVFDDAELAGLHLSPGDVERLVARERDRQAALHDRIRGSWPSPDLEDRTVVLVDDAVITGLTMRAAIASVRARGAHRVVVATSLCATEASPAIAAEADAVVDLESLPAAIAARVHGDERGKPCPPIGDAEIHELISRELRDVGADPFGALTVDGV